MTDAPSSALEALPAAGEAPAPFAAELRRALARIGRLHGLAVLTGYGAAALALLALGRWLAAALCGVLALLGLLSWKAMPSRLARHATVGVALAAMMGLMAVHLTLGRSPGPAAVTLLAVHAGVAAAVGGWAGAAVATATGALALALATSGWLAAAGLPLFAGIDALWVLAGELLALTLGAAAGLVAGRELQHFVEVAADRQQRFDRVLQISADAYWELDARGRLVSHSAKRDLRRALGATDLLGSVPWELPQFACDPDLLDGLLADLETRQPIRDVPVQWRTAHGTRHLLVSGEPRVDAQGAFAGYWGVAQDVTDGQRARQALAQTESRYHDLFISLPTPLVLHHDGRVLDANPAALMMFGHADLDTFIGSDLFENYEGSETRERALRRNRQLQQAAPGEALPVAEFALRTRAGRRLLVRATGVAVATPQGPGVLSIYVDDTDRQAAEQAVRRSEALLSHLVASSPDLITLQDLDSERYVMANQTFEAATGWSNEAALGRTADELGLWVSEDDRAAFLQAVRGSDRVQDWPVELRRRDGRRLPLLVSAARFVMDRRDYLVVNARDMSEAERTRLEREAILDNASIGIALTRQQRFMVANPAFEAMLGWPRGALVGLGVRTVWPDDDSFRKVGERITGQLTRGEQVEIEHELHRRDGSRVLCRMLARAVDPTRPSRGGTIWIIEDITERRRVAQALALARDEAEAANRAKSAFLANTSHELRTPLNGVLGLARMAGAPGVDPQQRAQYLSQIADCARSLALIVSDILDLSRIESGALTVEHEPFDLPALLQAVQQAHAAPAATRGLELTLTVDPGLGRVVGDALRVRQILHGYVGNAVKFGVGGTVQVVAYRTVDDRVRLEVRDSGPGIDDAMRERLFKPFSQADDSSTRRFGGTGLGLSICHELAVLMGGEVGVHSEPGAGSCFWAELPLPPVDEVPGDAAMGESALAELQGARVLVVDDNEVNLLVATAQLQQLGLRVDRAMDGQQALDASATADAQGDPYRLVMMDLQMPALSGFEVTRQLRQLHDAERLPIVACTAAALVAERQAALAAGMNDFLTKPIEADQLRRALLRWVGRVPA